MKRKPGLTPEQFRQNWNDPRFDALILRVAVFTGAARHAKNATLIVAANALVSEARGTRDPYDGVLEYWWDNAASLIEHTESTEGRALTEEMLAFQRQFVDLAASTAFFVEG
jgi:hypothetical protein